jgi:hypothetical protein
MKRYNSLCLFGLLVLSFSSQAQISLIPKAGVSISTYKSTTDWLDQTYSPGAGLTAGMGITIPARRILWLSLQPEVNYVQKTVLIKQTSGASQISPVIQSQSTRRNHYVEVPLLAKARFGSQAIQGFIQAGPSLGLFSGSTGKTRLTVDGKPVEITPEMKAQRIGKATHSLEVGLQAGGGIGLAIGPGTLLLEARYGTGLTNFVKKHQLGLDSFAFEEPVFITVPADQKSRTFSFTCGYAIPLKK